MATPNEKLAASLEVLRELQKGRELAVIKSSEISRVHRERLIRNGFLVGVAKGWYISTNPKEESGDSTSWYTSYWQFCSRFLEEKYGEDYTLSADQSILLHSGNNTIPTILVVRSPNAPNKHIKLLHGTSLFIMKSPLPRDADTTEINNVKCLSLEQALILCSPSIYETNPTDIIAALGQVANSSKLLELLLLGSHSVIAGRLAGAFASIGHNRIASEIIKTMTSMDFKLKVSDPFSKKLEVELSFKQNSPYLNRIKLMWNNMRDVVIKHFPDSPGIPKNKKRYLTSIDEIYVTDAYHSLSIERYVVSLELIEKVRLGNWNLDNEEDQKHANAMAARGYYLSSLAVKKSIEKILMGENSGDIADLEHGDWYRELFAPSVTANILKISDLAGYRNQQVYIKGSQHIPPNQDGLRSAMDALFTMLRNEENGGVRAVLGHFIFVYIHPYVDGNGRMGRFLMNVMLASGGFPWTVIPVEDRKEYMAQLEQASVAENIAPFAKYIAHLVNESLKGTPVAKLNSETR
jgi:hypothetical protein